MQLCRLIGILLLATRLYLPQTAETTGISPTPDAGWADTTPMARCVARTTKIADTITTVPFADSDTTNRAILIRQYVSFPLTAGQTVTGSQAFKAQIRASETGTGNNLRIAIGVRVIASNGTTVRKIVKDVTQDDTELATTLTNRQFTATSAATNYTTVTGDRLVIELGVAGDPGGSNTHSHSLSLGDSSATDLAENDSTTTANNPWIEFTDTWTFDGAVTFDRSFSESFAASDSPNRSST